MAKNNFAYLTLFSVIVPLFSLVPEDYSSNSVLELQQTIGNNNEKCEYCTIFTSARRTVVTNPNYPDFDIDSQSFSYGINVRKGVCAIRVFFEQGEYARPDKTVGYCLLDTVIFFIKGGSTSAICGNLGRYELVFPVQELELMEIVVNVQSLKHLWKIHLEQINCSDVPEHPFEGEVGKNCGNNEQIITIPTNKNDGPEYIAPDYVPVVDLDNCYQGDKCIYDRVIKAKMEEENDKIIGGQETEPGKWTWQVVLMTVSKNKYYLRCGGSILSKYWIITAAHCVYHGSIPVLYNELMIAVNSYNLSQYEENRLYYNAAKIVIHHQYNGNVKKDIALIKLDRPIDFNSGVNPICFPANDRNEYLDVPVKITGYGVTEAGRPSRVLLGADVTTISNSQCNLNWNSIYPQVSNIVEDSMICAGNFNSSVCNGDSGGPLSYKRPDGRWELVGCVSFGTAGGCLRPVITSVFTRMTSYFRWISLVVTEASSQDLDAEDIIYYSGCRQSKD